MLGPWGSGKNGCSHARLRANRHVDWDPMGTWYTAGVFAGLGVAIGVLLAGLLAARRAGLLAAFVLGTVAGAAAGALVYGWEEAVTGGFGGAVGALGATQIVGGAVVRGGTRSATALLVGIGAVVLAALAFVPVVGYLEAVVLPALAGRLRRRSGRTYAGLRILARD